MALLDYPKFKYYLLNNVIETKNKILLFIGIVKITGL